MKPLNRTDYIHSLVQYSEAQDENKDQQLQGQLEALDPVTQSRSVAAADKANVSVPVARDNIDTLEAQSQSAEKLNSIKQQSGEITREAIQDPDGTWRSSKAAVDRYAGNRYPRRPEKT